MPWNRPKSSPTQRGYGAFHRAERARWRPLVERGEVACARCGTLIIPGTPWHLDHSESRTHYLGPSHKRCNLRAAAQKGARIANGNRQRSRQPGQLRDLRAWVGGWGSSA